MVLISPKSLHLFHRETGFKRRGIDLSLTDQEITDLLTQVEEGSESAVQRLVGAHRGRLRRMVSTRIDARLRARVDPSDVVQDAMMEAARRLPEYSRSRSMPFYLWLRQLAWDRLIDLHHRHVTAQKRSVLRETGNFELTDASVDLLVDRAVAKIASPSREAIRNEMKVRVREHLDGLDQVTREVLLMHYVEQMKLREIASVLELTEAAVKSRHIRGLQRLAVAMRDKEDGK